MRKGQKTEAAKQHRPTNQKTYPKQMGQQLSTALYHRARLCALISQKGGAVGSRACRASDIYSKPALSSTFSSHLPFLSLSLPLPLTSRLSAFGSDVFEVLVYQKNMFERLSPPLLCWVFFFTSLLSPACISTSPILTLLLTAPPKLAPSVNTGVYFLFMSLMKVLNKTGLNMQQDPYLPLSR